MAIEDRLKRHKGYVKALLRVLRRAYKAHMGSLEGVYKGCIGFSKGDIS